jgi:hypothetical protein
MAVPPQGGIAPLIPFTGLIACSGTRFILFLALVLSRSFTEEGPP